MTGIPENLKQLRLKNNFTQEEVAQKIGLTRQAVSSYESGRTQPGIDMLMHFAEIYGVEIEEILYGQEKANKEKKRMKAAAICVTCLWLLCRIARVCLLIIADTFFHIEEGQITNEMMAAVEMHFKLSDWATSFETASIGVVSLGFLILLVFNLISKVQIGYKTKLFFLGVFIGVSAVIEFVASAICPFAIGGMLTVYVGILILILYMFLDAIGVCIKKRR